MFSQYLINIMPRYFKKVWKYFKTDFLTLNLNLLNDVLKYNWWLFGTSKLDKKCEIFFFGYVASYNHTCASLESTAAWWTILKVACVVGGFSQEDEIIIWNNWSKSNLDRYRDWNQILIGIEIEIKPWQGSMWRNKKPVNSIISQSRTRSYYRSKQHSSIEGFCRKVI